jgi:hypothetical protein
MTFLTGKTYRKSAPFQGGYLRAGGPIPAITAGPSLFPVSFAPATLSFLTVGVPWLTQGMDGVYHVPRVGRFRCL